MSGAGKSQAANIFEDIGYFCIDNMPPVLIPSIVDLSIKGQAKLNKIAIITDLRGGEMFCEITNTISDLKQRGINPELLFLDASDAELIRRYKENRRVHPLCSNRNLSTEDAIATERADLAEIRGISDYIVDTTYFSASQLKQRILDIFSDTPRSSIKIQVTTFGFKHGLCGDADLMFDVRCLPNPFYIDELKDLTGLDAAVQDYVMAFPQSCELADRLCSLMDFLIPLYQAEGKSRLVIAIGCTGGKHRSVTIAGILNSFLLDKGYTSTLNNRDINK